MGGLRLQAPGEADLAALYDFEMRNRAFFEAIINARPDSYYSEEGVASAIRAAQREAMAGTAYQYLVREGTAIVGRVNLTHVRRTHYHCASLGYRVDAQQNGRGIAKAAVRMVLEKAFGEHRLHRIEATCRVDNPGSIKVLTANGFSQFGHARKAFQLGESWYDLLYFEAHSPGSDSEPQL